MKRIQGTHKIQNWTQGSAFGTENKESWFNSQHMRQTVFHLRSVQTSSQVRTVDKRSKVIQGQRHKVEPQPMPKGKVGGATTPLATGLYLHLYLDLTQTL